MTVNIKDVAETLVRKVPEFRTAGELHMRARGAALDREFEGYKPERFHQAGMGRLFVCVLFRARPREKAHEKFLQKKVARLYRSI